MSNFRTFPEKVFTTEEREESSGEAWGAVFTTESGKRYIQAEVGRYSVGDLVIDFTSAPSYPRSRRSLPTHWVKCTNGERIAGIGQSFSKRDSSEEYCRYYLSASA